MDDENIDPDRGETRPQSLEKQLGRWDVNALATGATFGSGFFLLPGLAAAGAGAAMPRSYLLGALILLPGLLGKVELATAMPKARGLEDRVRADRRGCLSAPLPAGPAAGSDRRRLRRPLRHHGHRALGGHYRSAGTLSRAGRRRRDASTPAGTEVPTWRTIRPRSGR